MALGDGALKTAVVVVVLAASLAAVGCSPASEGDGDGPPSLEQIAAETRSRGYEWQAELMEDGDITVAEYDEGQRRTRECLTEAGMSHTEPVRNLPDGYEWLYDIAQNDLSDSAFDREMSRCFDEWVADLGLAMSLWGDWQTDPALLEYIVKCVEDLGFDVADGLKNYRQVWEGSSGQGLTEQSVMGCISDGMSELYPRADAAYGF
ncbi:MAG: hypothetical protein LBS27_00435 [Bifidobacteriaceae bacterium]|nr:hypothetical protein [Bifidobacteriaceae bacterium]